jgi:hypothetical protein
VTKDRIVRERRLHALRLSHVFETIETELAEVLNGEAINQHFFLIGLRMVIAMQVLADLFEDGALMLLEVREEKLIGREEAVLEGVHS